MPAYYLYILYSEAKDRFYIGHTEDLEKRLEEHNDGRSKSTKLANDWKVVHFEEYKSRSEAMKRESYLKKQKSRKFIQELIAQQLD